MANGVAPFPTIASVLVNGDVHHETDNNNNMDTEKLCVAVTLDKTVAVQPDEMLCSVGSDKNDGVCAGGGKQALFSQSSGADSGRPSSIVSATTSGCGDDDDRGATSDSLLDDGGGSSGSASGKADEEEDGGIASELAAIVVVDSDTCLLADYVAVDISDDDYVRSSAVTAAVALPAHWLEHDGQEEDEMVVGTVDGDGGFNVVALDGDADGDAEYDCFGLVPPGTGSLPFVLLDQLSPSNNTWRVNQELYWHYNPGPEIYSRKVFVGGLPPTVDQEDLSEIFCRFGSLYIDLPRKDDSIKSPTSSKGYAFLVFESESSVQKLVDNCKVEDDKMCFPICTPTVYNKWVQIRAWRLADADFLVDASKSLDPRKTIFVGGVPRTMKAVGLACAMEKRFGTVCYVGIDVDPELKYPKGAARVSFSAHRSYLSALTAQYIQLCDSPNDKQAEMKPYVLDDQMCDECQGVKCSMRVAPYFCTNIRCLQYYCDECWELIHTRAVGCREYHKHVPKETIARTMRSTVQAKQSTFFGGVVAYDSQQHDNQNGVISTKELECEKTKGDHLESKLDQTDAGQKKHNSCSV